MPNPNTLNPKARWEGYLAGLMPNPNTLNPKARWEGYLAGLMPNPNTLNPKARQSLKNLKPQNPSPKP
jgi:hypothetical protein